MIRMRRTSVALVVLSSVVIDIGILRIAITAAFPGCSKCWSHHRQHHLRICFSKFSSLNIHILWISCVVHTLFFLHETRRRWFLFLRDPPLIGMILDTIGKMRRFLGVDGDLFPWSTRSPLSLQAARTNGSIGIQRQERF